MSPNDYEIRAVRETETEAMIALMCRCFGLDPSSASRIFRADPFFDIRLKRVLVDVASGKIVSCLTLVPCEMRLPPLGWIPCSLPIGGIAGVCTEPELRGQGFAGYLLEQTLHDAGGLGFSAIALTAERPEFYVERGWAPCGEAVDWCAPAQYFAVILESEHPVHIVTHDEMPQRLASIHALYQSQVSDTVPGTFVRGPKKWRTIETLTKGRRLLVATDSKGDVTGYAAYDIRQSEVGTTAFVHECVAVDEPSRFSLLAFFSQNSIAAFVAGRSLQSEVAKLGLVGNPDIKVSTTPGVYIQICDLPGVLSKVVGVGHPDKSLNGIDLAVRIGQTKADDPKAGVTLTIRDGGVSMNDAQYRIDSRITGDSGALSQLALGAASASELRESGKIEVSGNPMAITVLDRIVPRLAPFLAVPDVF